MNSQVERVTTVEFVRDWIMSGDHEVSDWERKFAAAIDARSAVSASLASQPPVLDEREVIERCAKVADEEVAARRGQQKMAVINNFHGGQLDAALRIATAIHNLGGPDDVA